MANVKSKPETPKSASKEKGVHKKIKKSLTGPKNKKSSKSDNHIMKRPSTKEVLTPDQKVQYILQNGHKLKGRPEAFRGRLTYKRKLGTELPLFTKNGRLKRKTKCNLKLINNILKDELMISKNGSKQLNKTKPTLAENKSLHKQTSPAQTLTTPVENDELLANSKLPITVSNNNNNNEDIFDQNYSDLDFTDDDDPDYHMSDDELSSDSNNQMKNVKRNINNWYEVPVIQNHTKKPKIVKKQKKEEQKKISLDIEKPKEKEQKKKPRERLFKTDKAVKFDFLQCDICKRKFNRKSSLRRHMYLHLDINPFSCPKCGKGFRSRYNMQGHIKRFHKELESEPDIFICNICKEIFLSKENLVKHITEHTHTESPFKCIFCGKVFDMHEKLVQHEKIHMVHGSYQCTLCSMSYRDRTKLYLHVKGHLKIKDYVCQYCGKEFMRSGSLTRHLEMEHDGYRIVCPICNKNLKGHLTEHMRTHEKERPHQCPDCGQRFTQATQMNVHRRSHTGAKPYPCRICKHRFSHSSALMLHIRRHTGEKPFPCAMCPSTFSQLPHMKAHMRNIHGQTKPYRCLECDTFFKRKSELDNHETSCLAEEDGESSSSRKKKTDKKRDLEVRLSRMRFQLALLLTMIANKEKLKILGFNKRLIDDILVETLEAMNKKPCKNDSLQPLSRLKKNIEMLLQWTVPKGQLEKFKEEYNSTEDILEELTAERE